MVTIDNKYHIQDQKRSGVGAWCIVYGFEVDYNPELKDKNFNNNGTWGKIVNPGEVVLKIKYSSRIDGDKKAKRLEADAQLLKYKQAENEQATRPT